jgi:hypothetical protein
LAGAGNPEYPEFGAEEPAVVVPRMNADGLLGRSPRSLLHGLDALAGDGLSVLAGFRARVGDGRNVAGPSSTAAAG